MSKLGSLYIKMGSPEGELSGGCCEIDDWAADEIERLRAELETERMRLVACGVVAMADTYDSAKQSRDMHPDFQSASCNDVARRVDECIALREQVRVLSEALTELHDDMADRFDMNDPSTNPGIKEGIEQAAAALAAVREPAGEGGDRV